MYNKNYNNPGKVITKYAVQIGSFNSQEEAVEIMKKLQEIGLTGYLVQKKYAIKEIGMYATTKEEQ